MFTNKGGFSFVMWGVVTILALVTAALLLRTWGLGLEDVLERNKCSQEVRAHALTIGASGVAKSIPFGMGIQDYVSSEIDCPTEYERIGGGEASVKRQLADEMLDCWRTWGEGEYELFPREEGSYCHVCTVVEFDNDMVIDDFSQYLAEEKRGFFSTYEEELESVSTEDVETIGRRFAEANPDDLPSIDTGEGHAIIFKYIKGKEKILDEIQAEDAERAVFVPTSTIAWGYFAGSLFCASGALTPACLIAGGAGATFGAVGAYVTGGTEQQYMAYTAITPYTAEGITGLGCEYAPARQGQ